MSAEAIEDSQVLMFRRSQVERLIATDLSAAHQMLDIFVGKLNDAEAHMFRLGRQSALQQVAAFFVEIQSRLGQRRGSTTRARQACPTHSLARQLNCKHFRRIHLCV